VYTYTDYLSDIGLHFNVTFPPTKSDIGLMGYTMYQIDMMAKNMSRQVSTKNKNLLNIIKGSGINEQKALDDFYNSL